MSTLQELFNFPHTPGLRDRVAAGCWRTAKTIFQELDTEPNHAERLKWAVRVMESRDSEANVIAQMLKAIVTLKDSGQFTDSEIENSIANLVNAFALGV